MSIWRRLELAAQCAGSFLLITLVGILLTHEASPFEFWGGLVLMVPLATALGFYIVGPALVELGVTLPGDDDPRSRL